MCEYKELKRLARQIQPGYPNEYRDRQKGGAVFTCGYAGIVIVSFLRTNVTNSLYKTYEQRKPC